MLARIVHRHLCALENPGPSAIEEFIQATAIPLLDITDQLSKLTNPKHTHPAIASKLNGIAESLQATLSRIQGQTHQRAKELARHLEGFPAQLRPFIRQLRGMRYSPLSKILEQAEDLARSLGSSLAFRTRTDWIRSGQTLGKGAQFLKHLLGLAKGKDAQQVNGLSTTLKGLSEYSVLELSGEPFEEDLMEVSSQLTKLLPQVGRGPVREALEKVLDYLDSMLQHLNGYSVD